MRLLAPGVALSRQARPPRPAVSLARSLYRSLLELVKRFRQSAGSAAGRGRATRVQSELLRLRFQEDNWCQLLLVMAPNHEWQANRPAISQAPQTNLRGNGQAGWLLLQYTHLTHSISELADHLITRATDVLRGGLEKSQYSVFGNTKSPTRVWLPEALTRNENSNSMETPDDQIYIPWRRRHSVNGDRNPGIRTSSYPGARRIRLFLS